MTSGRRDRRSEFEDAVLPHVHSLYNVALKLTRQAEEAEDLVQEAMLRAYRFFDKYEQGTNLRAWLFKIMRNLFINSYRRDQREPAEVEFGGTEETLEALLTREGASRPGSTPEEILLAGSVDEEVERALNDLPTEYREVLLLAGVEGLAYKEIASVLGIPIGTVMSRLHRARRTMQGRLMEYAQDRRLIDKAPQDGARVIPFEPGRDPRRG